MNNSAYDAIYTVVFLHDGGEEKSVEYDELDHALDLSRALSLADIDNEVRIRIETDAAAYYSGVLTRSLKIPF